MVGGVRQLQQVKFVLRCLTNSRGHYLLQEKWIVSCYVFSIFENSSINFPIDNFALISQQLQQKDTPVPHSLQSHRS